MSSVPISSFWLCKVLWANVVFSTSSGALCILAATSLTNMIFKDPATWMPTILILVGCGLFGFAGFVGWVASRRPPPSVWVRQIILADLAWVIGTGLIFVFFLSSFTPAGVALLLAISLVVTGLAAGQFLGLHPPNAKT